MSNRGVIGKFKQNTDFGGRLGSQEAYLLSAGGFYPRFVAASLGTLISNSSDTVFLAKASGNDGTNTSVTDTSGNHTVTNNNARTQGFTPYHPGGYSTYFDGNGDYLSVADADASFNFGAPSDPSGNFTIEGWLYPTALGDYDTVIAQVDTWAIEIVSSKLTLWMSTGTGGNWDIFNTQSISKVLQTHEWVHFALVRNGNTITSYINGVSEYSATKTQTIGNSSNDVRIGFYDTSTHYWNGYMRDIRIVKGAAVYTANFTPPTTSLTAIDNTKLLACSLPYIADGSDNHTVTVNGNTKTLRFSPYDIASDSEYSTSSHGASVYFDGSGDYLTVADDASLQPGSANFTYEAWIYPTSAPNTYNSIFYKRATGSNYSGVAIAIKSSGVFSVLVANSGGSWGIVDESSASYNLNQWQHIAAVRSGSNFYFYVNGVQKISTTISFSVYDAGTSQSIGAGAANGDQPFTGYIADARIVKGSAVYTSAFTPPTSPLADIDGTSLLTCNTQPNVYDIGTGLRGILYGNANASTDQYKYGTSSLHFDGGGDYIDFEANENLALGTGPMTMEAWFKTGSTSDDAFFRRIVMLDGPTLNNAANPQLMIDSTTENHGVAFAVGSGLDIRDTITGITVNDNNWHHIALTRNNTNAQLFVDGTYAGNYIIGTQAFSPNSGAPRVRLGNYNGASAEGDWNGYIQDVRISRGVCRYPFIPAAETLTSGTLTKALACHADSETTAVYGADSDSLSVTKTGNVSVSDFGPGPGMKSCYFDGSGDYLTIDLGSAIGTSDFCVEGWAYRDASSGTSNSRGIFSISDNSSGFSTDTNNISLQYRNNSFGNEWAAFLASGQRNITDTDTVMSKWYHFVVQRNGGTSYVFIDGQMIYSIADTYDYSGKQHLAIGRYHSTNDWYGYISNLRVSVGSGSNFYANSFTVPAAELTS